VPTEPEPLGPTEPNEETFTEPLSAPAPEYPTLQEATTVTTTDPDRTNERGSRGQGNGTLMRNSDPVSILAGLVFFVVGGAYLLASGGHLTVNAGWTLSFLLLGLGLSGVVGGFLRARRNNRAQTGSRSHDDW
jgi:thiosulfate reductase cytochrome b subunit